MGRSSSSLVMNIGPPEDSIEIGSHHYVHSFSGSVLVFWAARHASQFSNTIDFGLFFDDFYPFV